MSAAVYNLLRRAGREPASWSNQELAELFRVAEILKDAGLPIETDSGLSDEGDPWFVFCRSDSGDVIAHFARVDGEIVACGLPRDQVFRGQNFRDVARRLLSDQPLVLPRRHDDSTTFLHPAVVITAFVATALLYSREGQAEGITMKGEGGTLREVLEPASSAIFSFLANSEARPDGKTAEQSSSLGQINLLSILSAVLVASAGRESFAEQAMEAGFDFAVAAPAQEESEAGPAEKSALRPDDTAFDQEIADAESAFGLETGSIPAEQGASGGEEPDGEASLAAFEQTLSGLRDGAEALGVDAAVRSALANADNGLRSLDEMAFEGSDLAVFLNAAAQLTQGGSGNAESSSTETGHAEREDDARLEQVEGLTFNLRDGGLVFESSDGASDDRGSFVLAFAKSEFGSLQEGAGDASTGERERAPTAEQSPDISQESLALAGPELESAEDSAPAPPREAQDSSALPMPEPARPEPIVFSGGVLLIEDFQVGVDILLIDDSVLDPASAFVHKQGMDLVMDFGHQGMITLVGAMDSLADVA